MLLLGKIAVSTNHGHFKTKEQNNQKMACELRPCNIRQEKVFDFGLT